MSEKPVVYYNRAAGKLEEETVLGDRMIRLAYGTAAGRFLGRPLFSTALFSRLLGWYADRGISRRRISRTAESLKINLDDYVIPEGGFKCFNDFFARHLKPGARVFAQSGFCSPADSRLSVYPELRKDTCIPVKGREFTVAGLLGAEGAEYAGNFEDGSLCVFRLCPADYHRFHFPDDGKVLATWRIPGKYHSVSPIALEQNIQVFTTNVRQVSILSTASLGLMAYIEVGAFGVASIRNTYTGDDFNRGDEKGYFTFGGSTIVTVLCKDAVRYDSDILAQNSTECLVRAGEHIADRI